MLRSFRGAAMRNQLTAGLKAAAFVYDMSAGERDTWVKRFAGPVTVTHEAIASHGRPVDCAIYRTDPSTSRERPLLVVTHGFAHEGHTDPRLQALCRRLARLGFIMASPQFDEMRHYRLGLNDLADMEAVIATMRHAPGVDASAVGVMAFSFGSAPTLIGLSRPPLRDQVAFALIFGGYFDLRRAVRYVLTGAYEGHGHSGRIDPPTRGDDRWKFLKGNLSMVPASATSDVFARAVEARIADPSAPVDISRCTKEERAAWALISNRDPQLFDRLYLEAGPVLDGWIRRMSPEPTADGIRARLFLVHSFTDQKTPFTESIAMSRGVPAAPPPSLTLLNAFAHVDLRLNWRSLRSLVREGLPGLVAVWRVVRDILVLARAPGHAPRRQVARTYPASAPAEEPATGRG